MSKFVQEFWVCSALLVLTAAAQNVDALSDPWTRPLVLRHVLLADTLSLQRVVLWPPPLTELASVLPPEECPPAATALVEVPHGIHALPVIGRHRFLLSSADSLLRLVLQLTVMGRSGYARYGNTSAPLLLGRLGGQALFRYGSMMEGLVDISNGVRLVGPPEAAIRTDPSLGRILKLNIEERRFFDRYIGYLQLRWGPARLRFGREPLSFGYSPIDNLLLSLQAPALDALLVDIPHGPFRFTYLHAAADGTDTANVPVASKYIALHRIGWEPVTGFTVALYDMIVYSGRGLDFGYLNPLAFFVSTGLQTAERSNRDNSLLALEVALRPRRGILLYGTLLVDDLNYATLFDTTVAGNTNKFAFQLGVTGVVPTEAGIQLAAEYVRLGPFVFSHRTIVNSWTHLNTPLGYPIQPNSDRWAFQLRSWLAPRIAFALTADYTRHGENLLGPDGGLLENVGGDILRGDGDMRSPHRFLQGRRSFQRRISLQLEAEWIPNFVSLLTLGYLHRIGGNEPLRQLWALLEFRVGY